MKTNDDREEIDRYIEYMYNGRLEKGSEEYIMLDKCARHFINWTRNAPHETTKTE